MAEKQEPCCARMSSRLTIAKDNLRRQATKLSYAPESAYRRKELDKAKLEVAEAETRLTEHEAEHAA